MLLTILEWAGAITGAGGALLLAFNNRWSGYGFVLFLLSNACWFAFGWATERYSMMFMQVVCTGTTAVGIWNWLVRPRLASKVMEGDEMLPDRVILLAGRDAVLNGARHG